MRFKRLKLFSLLVFVIGVVVLSALAQTNVATNGKWEVLANWGQLPAGANWGAPSQVSTTPEGQIVVFRRMVPSETNFAKPHRLKVVKVSDADTVERLASRMAIHDRQVERFRVLNALGANDRLNAGDSVKIVVEHTP